MPYPKVRFDGCDAARRMTCIFTENLNDLRAKIDAGRGEFEPGFLHTSTVEHEGTCYYRDVWSRDGGRGLIELARFGLADEARLVADYFLRHINHGDHWGRVVQRRDGSKYEIDGNALILLGIFNAWKANGSCEDHGAEILEKLSPVIDWAVNSIKSSPYDGLFPCESELSGNPDTPYQVYGIFPNYLMAVALRALESMAGDCGSVTLRRRLSEAAVRLSDAIKGRLVSRDQYTNTPRGCWINGIDGRDGRVYDFSEWEHTSWPCWHWTRQVPFIALSDFDDYRLSGGICSEVDLASYGFILQHMASHRYFRKYGFVSNSCWTGMAGRHDDTMFGYGQSYFTQAALMVDDVNVYSKCLEGIARLVYDGNVVLPLTHEMNPWLVHECYSYDNYEDGRDHSFGTRSGDGPGVADNPGDEGNLVQAVEAVKAFRLVIGIDNVGGKAMRIMPRLPWDWDLMEVLDYPMFIKGKPPASMNIRFEHRRWLRKATIRIESSIPLEDVAVRFGPFPAFCRLDEQGSGARGSDWVIGAMESGPGSSWVWVEGLSGSVIEAEVKLA